MMITLGGRGGAGKGTVARLLASRLGYKIISIGSIKRDLAKSMGLSIVEFDALGDIPGNEEKFDLQYEQYQQSLDYRDRVILDSRLGFYNQPHAFKVFLDVDPYVGAQRIFEAKRETDAYDSVEQVLEATMQREKKNRERYLKLYNVDLYDFSQYDCVIDTSSLDPEDVVDRICDALQSKKLSQ